MCRQTHYDVTDRTNNVTVSLLLHLVLLDSLPIRSNVCLDLQNYNNYICIASFFYYWLLIIIWYLQTFLTIKKTLILQLTVSGYSFGIFKPFLVRSTRVWHDLKTSLGTLTTKMEIILKSLWVSILPSIEKIVQSKLEEQYRRCLVVSIIMKIGQNH